MRREFETVTQSIAIPQGYSGSLSCYPNNNHLSYSAVPQPYDCMMQIYNATYRELCNRQFQHCHHSCKDQTDDTLFIRQTCSVLSNNQCYVYVDDQALGSICPGRLKHLVIAYSCGCVPHTTDDHVPGEIISNEAGSGPVPAPVGYSMASGFGGSLSLCQYSLFKRYIGCDG